METQILKSLFFLWFLNAVYCTVANAQIVYTDVKPDVVLDADGGVYNLDLNHDSITDFSFTLKLTPTICSSGESFNAQLICSSDNSEVVQITNRPSNIDTLDQNDRIDSNLFWGQASMLYKNHWHSNRDGTCDHTIDGIWGNTIISFAGLQIKLNNQYFYGWVRVQIISVSSVVIYDFAFDTGPEEPILAGDTGSVATYIHHIVGFTSLAISPNVFKQVTRISFSTQQPEKISAIIYNVTGRVIKILSDETINAGNHQLIWDARDETGNSVSDGIYLLKFESTDFSQTEKLMVAK